MYDGPMKVIETKWMNIWCILDSIIDFVRKLQKYTSLLYSCSTNEGTKGDPVMACGNELCENSKRLQGLTFDGTTW